MTKAKTVLPASAGGFPERLVSPEDIHAPSAYDRMSAGEAREALGNLHLRAGKALDPMIEAALGRLGEIGPKWTTKDQERWCSLFIATVDLIYPARQPRKSRAKPGKQEPLL